MLMQDWITIEPEVSTGVLSINDGEITTGIVKECGPGYWADNGHFISINKDIHAGAKILFTQHLKLDVNGVKCYKVRGRDVIEVFNVAV